MEDDFRETQEFNQRLQRAQKFQEQVNLVFAGLRNRGFYIPHSKPELKSTHSMTADRDGNLLSSSIVQARVGLCFRPPSKPQLVAALYQRLFEDELLHTGLANEQQKVDGHFLHNLILAVIKPFDPVAATPMLLVSDSRTEMPVFKVDSDELFNLINSFADPVTQECCWLTHAAYIDPQLSWRYGNQVAQKMLQAHLHDTRNLQAIRLEKATLDWENAVKTEILALVGAGSQPQDEAHLSRVFPLEAVIEEMTMHILRNEALHAHQAPADNIEEAKDEPARVVIRR